MNKSLPEIIAPKTSRRCWMNGGMTISFVYSNKGNFVVKGYSGDVSNYLDTFKAKGYRFIVNRVVYCNGVGRNHWYHSKDRVYINEPTYRKGNNYFTVHSYNEDHSKNEFKFKRLPNKWIDKFDTFYE